MLLRLCHIGFPKHHRTGSCCIVPSRGLACFTCTINFVIITSDHDIVYNCHRRQHISRTVSGELYADCPILARNKNKQLPGRFSARLTIKMMDRHAFLEPEIFIVGYRRRIESSSRSLFSIYKYSNIIKPACIFAVIEEQALSRR